MKKVLLMVALFPLAVALPAGAEMQPKTLARIVVIKVRPNSSQLFESGANRYHQWLRSERYPFALETWVIVSGERTGRYVVGTFGHDWKDFDEVERFRERARTEISADQGPFEESAVVSYWALMPELSMNPPAAGEPPAPFSSVLTFFLKPGAMDDALEVIKATNAAIKKTNWPHNPSAWYTLVNGGEGPALVLAIRYANWAEFQPSGKTLAGMLADAYGKERAQELFKKFDKGLQSERTEIFRYLPDLSYNPATE